MVTVNWQSNDVLSTVTMDQSQVGGSRPRVRTGYVNLAVPTSTGFEFLEDIGKRLLSEFRILSPTEALRIKYNLNAQDMTVERSVNQVSLWKIVFDRYHNPNFQVGFENRFPDFPMSWSGSRGELNSIKNMAQQDVNLCENIISRFLGSTLKASLLERRAIYPYSSALEVTNRIGQTQADPNVYSQDGLGRGAPSPALDFVSSAFCRVIQNPNEDQPNGELAAVGQSLRYIADMVEQGLTPFYPLLNPDDVKTFYGGGRDVVAEVRGTLGEARNIAGYSQTIARSFGSGEALKTIFDTFPSPAVKLAITSTLYPWVHNSANLGFVDDRWKQETSFNARVLNRTEVVKSAPLVRTLILMDYLNRDQALMRHTVGYLGWIKSKCRRALAVRGAAAFTSSLSSSAFPLTSLRTGLPGTRVAPGVKSQFTTVPLVRTSTSVIPPGTTFTGGSTPIQLPTGFPIQLPTGFESGGSFPQFGTSPAGDGTVRETQELVLGEGEESAVDGETEAPENQVIDGEKQVAENRRIRELERQEDLKETEAANKEKRQKYIYIGSALAVVSAIGALIYVKRKK